VVQHVKTQSLGHKADTLWANTDCKMSLPHRLKISFL
jgi:hypothetical protein